jgi:hypothetical protein
MNFTKTKRAENCKPRLDREVTASVKPNSAGVWGNLKSFCDGRRFRKECKPPDVRENAGSDSRSDQIESDGATQQKRRDLAQECLCAPAADHGRGDQFPSARRSPARTGNPAGHWRSSTFGVQGNTALRRGGSFLNERTPTHRDPKSLPIGR